MHFSDLIRDWVLGHVHNPADISYTSTVKSSLQTMYLLSDEHVQGHDDRERGTHEELSMHCTDFK